MRNDELDSVINTLKPAMVAELADAAYARRPDVAQVRTRAGSSTTRLVRERRPALRLAFATAAVAAAAALAAGTFSGGHGGGTGRNGTTGARAFLLASADTAAKQPATHGTCWYSRTRMWRNVPIPTRSRKPLHVPTSPSEFRAQASALTASSSEDWGCTLPGKTGMRFRSRGPLDIAFTFPGRKNEAAWKAAGSPPLTVNGGTTASKPSTTTYDGPSHLVNPDIGSHEIEWRTIARLPATKSGLESHLRKLWQQDRTGGANGYVAPGDFGVYVFESAPDLLMAPTTPGTRAALYRILAEYPSVHVTGRIQDREGRFGMAVTAETPDGMMDRLVIDPATARLLDRESRPGNRPGTPGAHGAGDYLAIERQGWVNEIGGIPAS